MKHRRLAVVTLIALALLAATGSILPRVMDAAYPRIKARAAAFDASAVADGSYEGSAFLLPVSVRVKVTVAGGRIASIELLRHFNGQGKPAEAMLGRVLEAQSLSVDAVSGATHSSLVILEALRDALSKGAKR